MIVGLAGKRFEHDHHFRVERVGVERLEVALRVEGQPVDARYRRVVAGIKRAQAAIAVGVSATDGVPSAIVGAAVEDDGQAGSRLAQGGIKNVGRDRAHDQGRDSSWPDGAPTNSPCSYTISPRNIVMAINPLSRAPSYGVIACR